MSEVANNNFTMIDNAAAACATAASYKLAKRIFGNAGIGSYSIIHTNPLIDLGVNLTSACFGLWVGSKVREKTREVRKNISTLNSERQKEMKEEISKQAKDFQDWMTSVE